MFPWRSRLLASLLVVLAASLATWLEPRFQSWAGSRTASSDLLSVALGDSRRLFAKHFYVKADAYFHSGYYPSIFDRQSDDTKLHMAANAGAGHQKRDEDDAHDGKPHDWIEGFGRHFYPSVHSHLGEKKGQDPHHSPEDDHDDHANDAKKEERELLPWLRLSATLDPERPETYVTAAFWLRSKLGKVAEAEQFLREGLQHIPGEPELLFELGRIYRENHKDNARARTVWEVALAQWRKSRSADNDDDRFLCAQILVQLAAVEEEEKNYPKSIEYLRMLLTITPHKASVQNWIDQLPGGKSIPERRPPSTPKTLHQGRSPWNPNATPPSSSAPPL
jgi:tetratricopeptide (TPR) repeat protein